MAKFLYKSRDNRELKELSKVWVCAHPNDIFSFVENDVDKILSLANCAIYYDGEPCEEYSKEELLDYLSYMQLFIVVVTRSFLCEENRALSIELAYALENHIPILPLVSDPSLSDLFNQKCGNIQYVSLDNNDETTVSSDEKLKKFFSVVLLKDEITKKIKESFDAYVFLSYRKKDRKYANELMKLIHQNDFCRDIAIWYDEFLTPGENFNEEIFNTIKKSELFIIAVTPNVLEDGNYIISIEYPFAVKNGLSVLPAEMITTDKKELKEKFGLIIDPTNAYDNVALSLELKNGLSHLSIRSNDNDPNHIYLIGLAYLTGVDVEINRERALLLISSASEQGNVDATEKLIYMYSYGDGVKQDISIASSMAIRFVEQTHKLYLSEKDEESYDRYMKAFYLLIDLFKRGSKSVKALETSKYYYDVTKKYLSKHNENSIRKFLHSIYIKGVCYSIVGDYPNAKKCYEEYLKKEESLLPDNLSKLDTTRIYIYIKLAAYLYNLAFRSRSISFINKAISSLNSLEKQDLTINETVFVSSCYSELSKLNHIFSLEKSLNFANKSKDLLISIQDKTKPDFQAGELANIYSQIAKLLNELGRKNDADECMKEAYQNALTYYEKTNDIYAKENLATINYLRAKLAHANQELEVAKNYFYSALKMFEEVIQICNSIFSLNYKSIILSYLSKIAKVEDKKQESISLMKTRIELLKEILKDMSNPIIHLQLGQAYFDYFLENESILDKQEQFEILTNAVKEFDYVAEYSEEQSNYRNAAKAYKLHGDCAGEMGLNLVKCKSYYKSLEYYVGIIYKTDQEKEIVISICDYLLNENYNKDETKEMLLVQSRYVMQLLKKFPNDEKLQTKLKSINEEIYKLNQISKEQEEDFDDEIYRKIVEEVFNE